MTAPLAAQPATDASPDTSGGAYGVLAEFDDPGTLYHACEGVRDAGFSGWDAHTPFPVHGLEKAMGLKASPVGWFVLIMGLGGAAVGMHMQWLVSTSLYPLVISGKPLFSWPAFVPIMFECGVLGGAAGAILGFLSMAKLPRHHHPLFSSQRFERVGDDRFFISIQADDPKFRGEETVQMLRDLGAQHVEWIEEK